MYYRNYVLNFNFFEYPYDMKWTKPSKNDDKMKPNFWQSDHTIIYITLKLKTFIGPNVLNNTVNILFLSEI